MRLLYAILLTSTIVADAQVANLQKRPDMRENLQTLPRVVANADVPAPVAAKINASLDRFNAEVRGDAKDCVQAEREAHHDDGDYSRSIEVTMNGPRYLSFTIEDGYDCGGVHPDDSSLALVYDLTTGSPVNWDALLPPAAKGEVIRSKGRLSIGVVHWPAMVKRARALAVKGDAEADCGGAYDDAEGIGFDVYLSAKDHAIALTPRLTPHINSALCTSIVLIKPDEAKRLGVAQPLVDAITNAK